VFLPSPRENHKRLVAARPWNISTQIDIMSSIDGPIGALGVGNAEIEVEEADRREEDFEWQRAGDEVRVDAYGSLLIARDGYTIRMPLDAKVLLELALQHRELALVIDMSVDFGRALNPMRFGQDAQRIFMTDNAGGSSDLSEAFSMELLARTIGARLDKTEMELMYFTGNGKASKITDYSITLDGEVIGVSVTRACRGFPVVEGTFTVEDATRLLTKKLAGVIESTRYVSNTSWEKQLLHVFVPDATVMSAVRFAYDLLSAELCGNTVLLLTMCTGKDAASIFIRDEKAPAPLKKRVRTGLGMKSEEHLKNLAASDPCCVR